MTSRQGFGMGRGPRSWRPLSTGLKKTYGLAPGTKLTTRKSVAAKAVIAKHSKDFNGTLNDPEVIKLCGISRNTYYRYKRQLKAGQ